MRLHVGQKRHTFVEARRGDRRCAMCLPACNHTIVCAHDRLDLQMLTPGPIDALDVRRMSEAIRDARQHYRFAVIPGGSGAWQIEEAAATWVDLFRRALARQTRSDRLEAHYTKDAAQLLVPDAYRLRV